MTKYPYDINEKLLGMREAYQDLWQNGKMVRKGARDCASRYEVIKTFCSQWKRPFTVLDLGAHLGYFSLRLTEDFPDCTVVAVERDPALINNLKANNPDRVIFLNRRIALADLRKMAACEHFDLILCLSFIHHQRYSFSDYVGVLRSLGDHLIMELALEPTAAGQHMVKQSYVPKDAEVLATHPAHFGTLGPRPMIHLHTPKTCITRPFIGCDEEKAKAYRLPIESNFESKTIRWSLTRHGNSRPDHAPWIRGINLRTYTAFRGRWPTKSRICELIKIHGRPQPDHGDLTIANTILSGDSVTIIDGYDGHKVPYPEDRQWANLVNGNWGSFEKEI